MDKPEDDVPRLIEIWRLSRDLALSANPMVRDCGKTVLAEVRATLRFIDPLSYEAEDDGTARSPES
jgi:hypothetical protein